MLVHKTRNGFTSSRRGATLVEASFVLSAFFILAFGFFEQGRIFLLRQLLQNAAREGARLAIVGTGNKATSDIQATVNQYLIDNNQLSNVSIQVYEVDSNGNNIGAWTNSAFSEGIAVQVDADCRSMLPTMKLMPASIHMQVRSIMRCEAN